MWVKKGQKRIDKRINVHVSAKDISLLTSNWRKKTLNCRLFICTTYTQNLYRKTCDLKTSGQNFNIEILWWVDTCDMKHCECPLITGFTVKLFVRPKHFYGAGGTFYLLFCENNCPLAKTWCRKHLFIIISRGAEGPGREILQHPPSVCLSVRPSVCLSVRHV